MKNRCNVDAYGCNSDCSNCCHYDDDTSVEIRLYDHSNNKIMYKRLSVSELYQIERMFGKEWWES